MRRTLVVLAGGLARRYGRLKQLEPVGPAGEALLDLTIRDAGRAGFDDVVVVVRQESTEAFLSHFDSYPPAVPVRLVIQERDGRVADAAGIWRPWGTGHALLAAAPHLHGSFGVANADDYYGYESLDLLVHWIDEGGSDGVLVAFPLENTLSAHGGVSRAVLTVNEGWLRGVREHEEIRREGDVIIGSDGSTELTLPASTPVSMNLWGLSASFLATLQAAFEAFRTEHAEDATAEFRLPDIVEALIAKHRLDIRVVESRARWAGLTFEADTAAVREWLSGVGSSGRDNRSE